MIDRQALLTALSRHIGAERGVRADVLAREICGLDAGAAEQRQLRHAVEQLRREGHHICGEPAHGYYLAATEAELLRTCQFLYARSMTGLEQVSKMRNVSLPDLRGQLRLPT